MPLFLDISRFPTHLIVPLSYSTLSKCISAPRSPSSKCSLVFSPFRTQRTRDFSITSPTAISVLILDRNMHSEMMLFPFGSTEDVRHKVQLLHCMFAKSGGLSSSTFPLSISSNSLLFVVYSIPPSHSLSTTSIKADHSALVTSFLSRHLNFFHTQVPFSSLLLIHSQLTRLLPRPIHTHSLPRFSEKFAYRYFFHSFRLVTVLQKMKILYACNKRRQATKRSLLSDFQRAMWVILFSSIEFGY